MSYSKVRAFNRRERRKAKQSGIAMNRSQTRTSIAASEFSPPTADPVEEAKLAGEIFIALPCPLPGRPFAWAERAYAGAVAALDDGGGTVDPWGGATMIDPDGGRS